MFGRIKHKRYFTVQELSYLDEFLRTEIQNANDVIERYKNDGHSYSKMYIHDATVRKSAFTKVLRKMYQL